MHAEEQGEIRDHLQVSACCSPAAGLNCGMIRVFDWGLFVYWMLLSALCMQFLQHVKCVKYKCCTDDHDYFRGVVSHDILSLKNCKKFV